MDKNINKNQICSKLANIYKTTEQFSGMCPSECTLCENREALMLLPYEEEFINENTGKKQKEMFLKNCCGYNYQPLGFPCTMLQSSGTCQVYHKRPFDCRSFPIVPRFSLDKDDSIEFFLANSYCPILKNLPSNFIKTTTESWIFIAEDLPLEWKKMYNSLNQHCYTNKSLM